MIVLRVSPCCPLQFDMASCIESVAPTDSGCLRRMQANVSKMTSMGLRGYGIPL